MIQKVIKKDDFKTLIDAAIKEGNRFYGPTNESDGVSLSELSDDKEVVLEYSNFKLPPKRQFFPWSEDICVFDENGMQEVEIADGEMVVFGLRPCDTLSLLYLDKVFLEGDYVDPYYQKRRENTIIISMACKDVRNTCFCTSLNSGPVSKTGSDILVYNLGDSLLFEACSDKGNAFIEEYSSCFKESDQADVRARDEQVKDAENTLNRIDVSGADTVKDHFHSPVWNTVSQTCLSCGVCTYLCPTCHCFGIYDEQKGQKGRRIKVQDSCMYSGFTSEASGHNPRPTSKERMRQRIMHKFCYTDINFHEKFCVGCGRCIINCPANIDIRETIVEVVT